MLNEGWITATLCVNLILQEVIGIKSRFMYFNNVLFYFQTPPRPALVQEKPHEILLPKGKFEKFEKRMQTPNKVSSEY